MRKFNVYFKGLFVGVIVASAEEVRKIESVGFILKID